MFVVYGTRLFGKVDRVPGLFHVETRFGHFNYVPIFPLESYVVLSKTGDNFNGVRIPLCFKSVSYAWARAATLVAAIISLVICVIVYQTDHQTFVTATIVGLSSLASCLVLSFHKGSTHATYSRAIQIGEQIGLSPEGLDYIDQVFFARPESAANPVIQDGADRFNADL